MKISIIGSGNMAHFVALSFHENGHTVHQIYSRRLQNAQKLAAICQAEAVTKIEDFNPEIDALFLLVNDHAIAELAQHPHLNPFFLVHCAGSQPISLLQPTIRPCAVIWPIYSINKNQPPIHLSIPLVIESNSDKVHPTTLSLAHILSDNVTTLSFSQREKLHLSAVMSNNFINHLLNLNHSFLNKEGLNSELLKPIIKQTFLNHINANSFIPQTGPAARGDIKTITRHLQLLENHPQMHDLYKNMSEAIINYYLKQ